MAPSCAPLCPFDDRLYFTTFSGTLPDPHVLNSSVSASEWKPRIRGQNGAVIASSEDVSYYYFTVDDQLVYLSFFQDWGPLNLAMVYKACILIHELLQDEELKSHRLVLYASDDPRRKANAALLLALYVMIVQRRPPWEAFHPIACLEFMPFRDAGRGPSDFNLSIQDCLWGIWKAMQNGLCDMNEFSVEEYEFYEKVENGDWNWVTPHFIAFASPLDSNWIKREKERKANEAEGAADGSTSPQSSKGASSSGGTALQRKLPQPFTNCLEYFDKHNVKLVVRLNTELYDREVFLDRGINHEELYFDDGTNPTDEIVRKFIDMADEVIEGGGAVAVHCKAGLGRTGTLIGAYMIWKYGFTANEAIAFMRIVRPGSVVGPQQHYMYLKQLEWNKWSAVDEVRRQQEAQQAAQAAVVAAPLVVTPATPPAEEDLALAPDVLMEPVRPSSRPTTPPATSLPPVTPSKHIAAAQAKARAIEPPGQPRKTPNAKRVTVDPDTDEDEQLDTLPALNLAPAPKKARQSKPTGVTASEQRPTRVTRSVAANIRKAAGSGSSTSNTRSTGTAARDATGSSPNKIPRLAAHQTRSKTNPNPVPIPAPSSRRVPPTPSRLPTLAPGKRGHAPTQSLKIDLKDVAAATVKGNNGPTSDAWMTSNAASAVVDKGKSDNATQKRPGLTRIRRRRSSFSAADVVA